ncbi:MAG TPA: acyl-CoA dehydrogenase family protein [Actinocrinis sp.]|jgi:alkylation response protein AidB-like acyl-CoA dehydrogenase
MSAAADGGTKDRSMSGSDMRIDSPHSAPDHVGLQDSDETLLAEAERLTGLLQANAAETERRGRLPDENANALRAAGFFTLQAPRRYGGRAAGLREVFEVYTALARGCPSSSWVSMILSGSALVASHFDDRARAEVWGEDPRAAVCSSFIPGGAAQAERGGVRISGRWQPMSGVYESQWTIVTTAVRDEHGAALVPHVALVPMGEASIDRTWHVAGLQGTGSETVVLQEVFVPEHRLLSMPKLLESGYAAEHPDEPLCIAPVLSLLAITTVAPVLGMAEAVLRQVKDSLDERMAAVSVSDSGAGASASAGSADFRAVQLGYADAVSLLDLARLSAERAIRDVEHGIQAAEQLDLYTRARIRVDVATAARYARDAVDRALSLNGSRSFANDNPLQRFWRDMEIATRHVLMSQERSHDLYAQVLFGARELSSPV